METELWAIGLVVIAGLIGGFGPVYFKEGVKKIDLGRLSTIHRNYFLIIGVLVYGLATLLFIPALKGGELSVLYPFIGLSYAWVAVYSMFLLKEKMNLWKWLGVAMLMMGIAFIGAGA